MNICISCGIEYQYDSNNPLGASSVHCCGCRKKNTKFNKLSRLFEIAGTRCLKCGYNRSIYALKLMDAVAPITAIKTQEQQEKQAHKQFPLCLNCDMEIKVGDVEMKVISSNPIKVEFYLKEVQVTKTKIEQDYHTIIPNVEIVSPDEEAPEFRKP